MLDDVLGAFLDSVTEPEFNAPFLGLLRARGYSKVHFTHGPLEFGKDSIGQIDVDGRLTQDAFQLKAGDLKLSGWRDARQQIEDIRTTGLAHPDFDRSLPRRGILVLTGRLKDQASLAAQEYRETYTTDSKFHFEVWDRDRLVEMLLRSPEVGLSGTVEGPLLSLLGRIDERKVTDDDLERFSRRWIGDPANLRRAALECAIVAARARASGRRDLSALTALGLLRGVWATVHGQEPVPDVAVEVASAARGLFAAYGAELMDNLGAEHLKPKGLLEEHREIAFPVTYPVRALRIAEIIALYGLLLEAEGDPRVDGVRDYLHRFVRGQPGVAHPISDRWAVAVVPIALELARTDPQAAEDFLREVLRWVLDRYDKAKMWGLGLAGSQSTPNEEIRYLLGGPFEHVDAPRRGETYLGTILMDLTNALGFSSLYEDTDNDLKAVDAFPVVLQLPDSTSQYGGSGQDLKFNPNVRYRPTSAPGPAAAHHVGTHALGRAGLPWDLLALSALLRDRHWPEAITVMALATNTADPTAAGTTAATQSPP
jgi:hypothetical protein